MADINIETLRYYEKNELIPVPIRTDKGYRLYSEDVLSILYFIKSAKNAGFTLEQIRRLFAVAHNQQVDLTYIEALINTKITEIDEKLTELKNMQQQLLKVKENLYKPHECPLLNAFVHPPQK